MFKNYGLLLDYLDFLFALEKSKYLGINLVADS
jgi:hypothetical protein